MGQVRSKVVAIAGPNGSGKTTLAPMLLRDAFGLMEYVNADPIAQGLSGFRPEAVAFHAGRIMINRMRELAREEKNFAFETTLATRAYEPWIRSLQKNGYTFHLLFLWLRSSTLAVQRVKERVRLGGHAVEGDVVERRYSRGLRNFFDLYLPLAKTWAMYDNSLLGSPVLIASGSGASKIRIVKPELWKELRKA